MKVQRTFRDYRGAFEFGSLAQGDVFTFAGDRSLRMATGCGSCVLLVEGVLCSNIASDRAVIKVKGYFQVEE